MKKKLAIVTSHPIQYNAPWFRLLNEAGKVKPKVFYTWSQIQNVEKYDPGFGKKIFWDIPLLEGYDYCYVMNTSAEPGTHHFKGLVNPTLIAEIEAWKPDAILVFGWAFHSHLCCLRYFHNKKPVLFRGDSTLLDEKRGVKTLLRRIFLKWVYSHIDIALYVGINNKKYFVIHGLNEDQLVYAPHAIDNIRFEDNEADLAIEAMEMRNQLGISNNEVLLLFAGKLEDKKNPFFLIDLLDKNRNQHLNILFVGNGPLENSLKQKAAADKRIYFLDFQNQKIMPVIYRMADIFILPSTGPGETWGLSLNEAMACGKPVVATEKVGGAVDLIRTNINGIIIHANNTTELELLLDRAFLDKKILYSMGMNSKKIIQQFSFHQIIETIDELMNKLSFA